MNPLNRKWFYRGFRRQLSKEFRQTRAEAVWQEAGQELWLLLKGRPTLKRRKGAMVLPAVALYRAFNLHNEDAEQLLNRYGNRMGQRFAGIVHGLTGIPGVSGWIWKHVDSITRRLSSEKLGYRRRIVSRPPDLYGVDILSCPYHELAKELEAEKAALCICHKDKAYMQGFRCIRYERTTAVSEGAECCDYRLRYDAKKH